MTREFFAPRWLKRHPVVYMTSHMVILPLVDLYATACDWWVAGRHRPPRGLYWFLIVSYLNGLVIEIGRKTRVPADEEPGVETYSALWGTGGAVRAWLIAVLVDGLRGVARGRAHRHERCRCWLLLAVLVVACGAVALRVRSQRRAGKRQGDRS